MMLPDPSEVPEVERFLVAAICNGHTYEKAAAALHMPEGHACSLVRKLKERYEIANREQLGVWAGRLGLA